MADTVGIERFAEETGYSVEYARKLVRQGKGPRHVRTGRKIRFFMADIRAWQESHMVESARG